MQQALHTELVSCLTRLAAATQQLMYTWPICQLTAITLTAGTQHDLVEALVFTRPGHVDLNIINGRIIVQGGKMLTVDVPVSPLLIAAVLLNASYVNFNMQPILNIAQVLQSLLRGW